MARQPRPRANVYIDGFNLYYGCVRGTPYKWLDLRRLCRLMLQDYEVGHIRYFTARVRPRPNDPRQQQRQQIYLRALATLPGFSIHEGFFLESTQRARLVAPIPCVAAPPCVGLSVEVHKTEEKGSDVNLATHLLVDAFDKAADAFVIVSNDSDLTEPIRVVRGRFGRDVGLLNPYAKASRELARAVTFNRPISERVLRASLFPATLADAVGPFTKPSNW
jgi:uncharacterized LabA/DUF88 family protein